ncbi:F0F1 ATP synthase subunit I [Coxiella endosymbiont of Amblyomma sculptum]|nr:F0F1 ATP synthase subunit I [Coxiella endosymbiont of Amblyomma sculptum]
MTRFSCTAVYQLVGLQTVVVVVVFLGWWIVGLMKGISVLLGGMAYLLPGLYFAHHLFGIVNSSKAEGKQIVIGFYIGELIKFVLSIVLIIIILLCIPISVVPFSMGYVAAQFGLWLAPFIIKNRERKSID